MTSGIAESESSGRRSPPTERVVQILDFLVAREEQRFGLSELARALSISKPTCLGILSELVVAGYLTRDPVSKTYGLGPALIAAGRAAQRGFAVGTIARAQLDGVAAEFGAVCTASAVVGDQVMILETVTPAGMALGRTAARVGQAYPFAPPVGLMYVIWDSDDDLEAWLRRDPALPVVLDRELLGRVVDDCREVGYLVERLTPVGRKLFSLMAGVAGRDLPTELRELIGEMVSSLGERVYLHSETEPDIDYPVSLIAAPVYDADGHQSLVLTLDVGGPITGAEIARRGAALVAAADAVTAEVGGRRPVRCS
ncbi:IclR family transcriptional regulator [Prescottella equi]|uniref:ArsR family transcriptional regulator n=1 Tax=Rhodococcus hoagii TaxID=43767 RepID=A0AAE5INY1_RHOHA|nr:helix-turn-helix domain-containing protein [Prescottella equi]MBU4616096.1 helix-turn-helix domain-containing protein [Rhodococcus sp. GG48]ERN46432.1 IclR family transcriptional regulator [Prescottella equi NBRC 101255 = C 7]MBM4597388.1 helix-turn-helix domain-containing protein [Prescottella equi]MBM4626067.1 helix-turn-helix domain-containing protein [Prescottella equi]NKS38164.1 helix-turn-helix domain-containing protein [Prescottella equi]